MENIKDLIQSVLDEKVFNVKIPMMPIKEIEKICIELGADEFDGDDLEINGWQVDFWQIVKFPKYPNKTFRVQGSLYYGKFQFDLAEIE